MEETRQRDACPTCGSALAFAPVEWLQEESRGEETVWELRTEPVERAAIVESLITSGIAHRWDTPRDLVAAEEDEAAVDLILDEVLGAEEEGADPDGGAASTGPNDPDHLDDDDDDEEEGEDDGEDGYKLLSDLYIATDRVLRSDDDLDVSDFGHVVGATLMADPPFGVDDEKWADIQAAARNAMSALDRDDVDIEADPLLLELKGLLKDMV
jgi:hypothetical protein